MKTIYETRTFSLGIDHVGTMNITGASRAQLVKLAADLRIGGHSFFLGETGIDSQLEIIDVTCDQAREEQEWADLGEDDPICFHPNA
jgi:hypothetical protein